MNNDLISRSELKKAIEQGEGFSWDSLGKDDLCVRKKYIDNAPSVIPFASVHYETFREYERPIGKWLNNRVAFYFTCDYCGCNIRQLKDEVFEGNYDYNFCPNCGADMRGNNHENND